MKSLSHDPSATSRIENDISRLLETLDGDMSITPTELDVFAAVRQSNVTSENYSAGRTKSDVAVKLGTTASMLSKVIAGQNVLDIGCGTGVFAADIAKDKSINVVALDYDADLIADVPIMPNITPLVGNGYDLSAAGLQRSSFDSVFATYATNYWANTLDEVEKSILEPLIVLKPGGSLFMTPIAQDLSLIDTYIRGTLSDRMRSPTPEYSKVYGLFMINAYRMACDLETDGIVVNAFRTSTKNALFNRIALPDGYTVAPDSYSVVMTKTT